MKNKEGEADKEKMPPLFKGDWLEEPQKPLGEPALHIKADVDALFKAYKEAKWYELDY